MPGSGLGQALGLGVLARTIIAVRSALDWMPGRILVLADDGLAEACQERIAHSAHLRTLAGIVVLADDEMDLSHLAAVESSVPMVLVVRSHDQRCLRRAVRIGVEVRQGVPQVDLRPHRFAHSRHAGVHADSSAPGTVPR
ncbi:MAG: hypothetical protein WCF36_11985 [Candidatus Nanopelagicales bacterium]